MTKYKTGDYRELIEVVEVERETDKTVWVKEESWRGKATIRQRPKNSIYYTYHDTWEAARDYLLRTETARYERALKEVEQLREKIDKINALKPPALSA